MRNSTGRYLCLWTPKEPDAQWKRIAPLLPSNAGRRGHPFGDDRRVVEGIAYRFRTGIPWRDLPREQFGPWQTVWKRHRAWAGDGTLDEVHQVLLALCDGQGALAWDVSVDSSVVRAHQHATNTTRPEQDNVWIDWVSGAVVRQGLPVRVRKLA